MSHVIRSKTWSASIANNVTPKAPMARNRLLSMSDGVSLIGVESKAIRTRHRKSSETFVITILMTVTRLRNWLNGFAWSKRNTLSHSLEKQMSVSLMSRRKSLTVLDYVIVYCCAHSPKGKKIR